MARGLPSTASLARFWQKLNRLKTLKESTTETSLQRHLTTLDLTLLGVGGMVGSGLYVLTGTVAKEMAGPALLMSFCVATLASLLAALCHTEFGARVPRAGSAYLFTYMSMGELWAFLIGWNVLLEYLVGGTVMARAWSGYLDAIFSHRIRSFTVAHVGIWQVPFLAQYPDFLASGITLLASALISCRCRIYSWLNHIFLAVSLVVILFIIILGFVLARPHNWSTEEGGFAPFGFSGVMAGAATCFYAFVGFDIIAVSCEEAQNPKRAVPMAITISLGLVAGGYILVSIVLTLIVPWHSLDPDSALADAFYQRGYNWAGLIVAAGSVCAMNTLLLNDLFYLPRMVHAMAADGLFFQVFTYMHPQTQVPMSPRPGGPPATAPGGHLSGSHGAPDSSPEHPPQHLPHAADELPDLAALVRLATDRTCGVFWLWHQAQQGEPAGAARVDCHTRQPGGDGAGPTAPQPGPSPGAQSNGAGYQSMRTAGGLPVLPYLLRRLEGMAAPSIWGSLGLQACPCHGVLRITGA
ncbi:cationic amino acid transporter 4-like isoform X5 [Equus asinus]|uniref:cationic amino acid transporter 4-like isoform X5 n=1 Tax=Equus asinus TaxID=9793 RepID=UPI0038F69E03